MSCAIVLCQQLSCLAHLDSREHLIFLVSRQLSLGDIEDIDGMNCVKCPRRE